MPNYAPNSVCVERTCVRLICVFIHMMRCHELGFFFNLHKNLFNIYNCLDCLLLVYHYFPHTVFNCLPNFACNLKLLYSFITKHKINNIKFQLIDTLFSLNFSSRCCCCCVACPRFIDLYLKHIEGRMSFFYLISLFIKRFPTKLVMDLFYFNLFSKFDEFFLLLLLLLHIV